MKKLESILRQVWEDGSDTKFALGNKQSSVDTALSAIKKELEACVPGRELLYGGEIVNLPPDFECSNVGFNQCRTETLTRIKEL